MVSSVGFKVGLGELAVIFVYAAQFPGLLVIRYLTTELRNTSAFAFICEDMASLVAIPERFWVSTDELPSENLIYDFLLVSYN